MRCFIDFQVKMWSRKLAKGVWNSRESLRLEVLIKGLPASRGVFQAIGPDKVSEEVSEDREVQGFCCWRSDIYRLRR